MTINMINDQDIIDQLRGLDDPQPDPTFHADLSSRLLEYGEAIKLKKRKTWLTGKKVLLATGALFLILAASRFLPIRVGNDQPLLFLAIQADAAGAPAIVFQPDNVDQRPVRFTVSGILPESEKTGTLVQLQNRKMTREDAMRLAVSMGIDNGKIQEANNQFQGPILQVENEKARLQVWCNQGSWMFNDNIGNGEKDLLSSTEAYNIAVQWLKDKGLMPSGGYRVSQEPVADNTFKITLTPETEMKEKPILGTVPRIELYVSNQGKVIQASGTWYDKIKEDTIPVMDFTRALKLLEEGKGVFIQKDTPPVAEQEAIAEGNAIVQKVSLAYQLAYSLDYTPYYAPVAVFEGQFSPNKGGTSAFTAYVSLVDMKQEKNAAHFTLEANLPVAAGDVREIEYQASEPSKGQLDQLAKVFGVEVQNREDSLNSKQGSILPRPKGGWEFRSSLLGKSINGQSISDAQAIESAGKVIAKLSEFNGVLGTPQTRVMGSGGDKWVFYPLLYGEKPVLGTGMPEYASFIGIQVGPQGDIWSAVCSGIMKETGKTMPVIAPQQAWDRLLNNQYKIRIEGFFGLLSGECFAAGSSKVDNVILVYRLDPFGHNTEDIGLSYMFSGKTLIGGNEVPFSAYVDASVGK